MICSPSRKKDKQKNEMEIKGKVQMIVGDMARRIEGNGGVESTEVKSVDIDESKKRATVILTVNFKDGKQKDERFMLTKDEGDWKIILR
ncbi:Lumazine-binding domain [Morganella morganii]|nr:Lumazine-binding domain [Morganella morganii]